MLLPLTIALFIVAFATFTIYAFRRGIARWLGIWYRQIKQDEMEMRREYEDGRRNRL